MNDVLSAWLGPARYSWMNKPMETITASQEVIENSPPTPSPCAIEENEGSRKKRIREQNKANEAYPNYRGSLAVYDKLHFSNFSGNFYWRE